MNNFLGDSGGSIVVDYSGRFISVGVLSWASADCGSAHPDVFARTSFYYYWIREVIEIVRPDE